MWELWIWWKRYYFISEQEALDYMDEHKAWWKLMFLMRPKGE